MHVKAMREAKDAWFRKKAEKAQLGRYGGKEAWRSIRDLQSACRGLVPRRSGNIKNEEGHPCITVEETQRRWRRHFTKVLNIESHFNTTELDKVRQRPVRMHLAELPSLDEHTHTHTQAWTQERSLRLYTCTVKTYQCTAASCRCIVTPSL